MGRVAVSNNIDGPFQLVGQCVAISGRVVLTCKHVCVVKAVDSSQKSKRLFLRVIMCGVSYRAEMIRSSGKMDIAVLVCNNYNVPFTPVEIEPWHQSFKRGDQCALLVFIPSFDLPAAPANQPTTKRRRAVEAVEVDVALLSVQPHLLMGHVAQVVEISRTKPGTYLEGHAVYSTCFGYSGGGVFNPKSGKLVGIHLGKEIYSLHDPEIHINKSSEPESLPVVSLTDNAVDGDPPSRNISVDSHTSNESGSHKTGGINTLDQASEIIEKYAGAGSLSVFVVVESIMQEGKWSLGSILSSADQVDFVCNE